MGGWIEFFSIQKHITTIVYATQMQPDLVGAWFFGEVFDKPVGIVVTTGFIDIGDLFII